MYRICQADPCSWDFAGNVVAINERPDWEKSDELPDGQEVEVSIQGRGTRAFLDSGEGYSSWSSVEEIDDDDEQD